MNRTRVFELKVRSSTTELKTHLAVIKIELMFSDSQSDILPLNYTASFLHVHDSNMRSQVQSLVSSLLDENAPRPKLESN